MGQWQWEQRIVGIGRQSAADVPEADTDCVFFPMEVDVPSSTRSKVENAINLGQTGTKQAPSVGIERAEISLKFPMFVLSASYDPQVDAIGTAGTILHPAVLLLGELMGARSGEVSSASDWLAGRKLAGTRYDQVTPGSDPYLADAVTARTSSSVTVDTGMGAALQTGLPVVCASAPSSQSISVGVCKSVSGDVATIDPPFAKLPTVGDDIYGAVGAYMSESAPEALTIIVRGATINQGLRYVGCVPTEATISGEAGETPVIEIKLSAIGVQSIVVTDPWSSSSVQIQQFAPVPPLCGTGAGQLQFFLGSWQVVQNPVRAFKLSIMQAVHDFRSINSDFGVSGRDYSSRSAQITIQLGAEGLYLNSNPDATKPPLGEQYEIGNEIGILLFSGNQVGRIFGIYAPRLVQTENPKLVEVDGILYAELQLGLTRASGESGSGDATNSPLRVFAA